MSAEERIENAMIDFIRAERNLIKSSFNINSANSKEYAGALVIAARLEQLNDSVNALTEKVGELCDATWRR